jgi:hypothetical protein
MHTIVRPLAQEPSALNATTHHNKDFMLHVLSGFAEGTTHNTGTHFQQECTHFTKIVKTPHKYSRQKGDKKQITYRGSTNIRCHYTKFSRHGDLAIGIYAPQAILTDTFSCQSRVKADRRTDEFVCTEFDYFVSVLKAVNWCRQFHC